METIYSLIIGLMLSKHVGDVTYIADYPTLAACREAVREAREVWDETHDSGSLSYPRFTVECIAVNDVWD